ncbi:hypothetical protein CVT25_008973 [Psilocybe cyanescens]|uniref:Uncharacterized protein n=1 Tax=Psilocybe cyanescens TaxID=93625 RepID=A0A409XN29_PSICY|nr:hypothetical protein CVT25_008973 [Psilocybe cyanescens]
MGSICLSSASILRCTPITQLHENILLVIPTALEVIFSTSLIFAKWGQGRRHLLLTAEGWTYLILTVIELLSNVVPAVRSNLSLFRGLDLGIDSSKIKALTYGNGSSHSHHLNSEELTDTLPKRLQNVTKLSLIIFVPAIVIFNEIASFIGVTIRSIPGKTGPNITIGFADDRQGGLWTFFTSMTLALLIVYQASVFCFAFFRLTQALLSQRRIERKDSDKAHFANGIGWISGAAKLGALETVIGFAGGGFGISLTRRIMRMLARAFMCIGIIKGVDVIEDFEAVKDEIVNAGKNGRNNSQTSPLHQFISNPRLSTFRQLSPTATAFHAAPRAPQNLVYADEKADEKAVSIRGLPYITTTQRQSVMTLQLGLPGMDEFASIKDRLANKRVTVKYNQGTPRLHMRFSTLSLPSPALAAEDVKARPQSTWYEASSERSRYTQSSYYFESEKKPLSELDLTMPPMPHFHNEKGDADLYRDSLNSLNGPFEIVNAPQRKLSQRAAQARVYQAPVTVHNVTPETMAAMAFPEPTHYPVPADPQPTSQVTINPMTFPDPKEYPTVADSRRTTEDFDARVKSMTSVRSMPDSIKAVRELASQFPGPPGPFQYKSQTEQTTWEDEDSGSSVLYPPGIMAGPQVIGSPSELVFKQNLPSPLLKSSAFVGSEYTGSEITASPMRFSHPSPVKAGKTPVTPRAGGYRTSGTPRSKGKAPYNQKSIDPFEEDESRKSYNSVATAKPQPLKLDTSSSALQAPASRTRKAEVPETPQGITPGTVESVMTDFHLIDDTTFGEDPFVDLGMALDTGKSRQFKVSARPISMGVQPMPKGPRTPTTPRKLVPVHEKLSRIAEWVDTSASVAVAPDVHMPVSPPARRDNNLQNLHDRGKSIDNIEIPWLRNSRMAEENERKLARANGASQKPQLARLKSVGMVPSKPTPTPMRSAHPRGSLHLLPIIIPPRTNMPEAIQVEIGSLESRPGRRGVLRDSEVLDMEDTLPSRQKENQYF